MRYLFAFHPSQNRSDIKQSERWFCCCRYNENKGKLARENSIVRNKVLVGKENLFSSDHLYIDQHDWGTIFIQFDGLPYMKLVKRYNLHPIIIVLSKAQQLGLFPRGQLSGAITEVFHCNLCLSHCNLYHCCHHCHLCLCHPCLVFWFRHCCHRRQSIWILPSCHCHTYDNITR